MKAILVSSAVCKGSGSDKFKRITGLTKAILSQVKGIDAEAVILVPSNTQYQGQMYKLAKAFRGGFNHRQINDADYQIIATI